MTPSATFGLIIPQRGSLFGLGSLRELLQLGVIAERSGCFEALWLGDSLTSKSRPEAVSCLSALAGMTEQVRLAIGCMATFPARNPALFAHQWATLDRISEGRALLSVCNGLQPGGLSAAEGRHLGGVLDRERASRLEENIAICRRLWTGEEVDFEGRYTSYAGIQLQPTPVQQPCPIWITANPGPGAARDRVLRRVAELADGFQTSNMAPHGLGSLLTDLRPLLVAAGRNPDTFPVGLYHNINIGPSADDCLEEARRFAAEYYGEGFMSGPALASMTSAGTAEECVASIRELIDQGANHVALRCASFDQRRQLDLLINDVLPALLS